MNNDDEFVASIKKFQEKGLCGEVRFPDGTSQVIHVCGPGTSACQCAKHVYPTRAGIVW